MNNAAIDTASGRDATISRVAVLNPSGTKRIYITFVTIAFLYIFASIISVEILHSQKRDENVVDVTNSQRTSRHWKVITEPEGDDENGNVIRSPPRHHESKQQREDDVTDATHTRRRDQQQRLPAAVMTTPFSVPPSQRNEICARPGLGPEGPAGYRFLTERIIIDGGSGGNSSSETTSHDRRPTVFCAVYTALVPTEGSLETSIRETWGGKCDGLLIGDDNFFFTGVKKAKKAMMAWERVLRLLIHVSEEYGASYDFFHLTGDDTFLIVENLRALLREWIAGVEWGHGDLPALYFGRPLRAVSKNDDDDDAMEYMEGEWTINRDSLSRYAKRASSCLSKKNVAKCAQKYLGGDGMDGRDESFETRYHGYDPEGVFRDSEEESYEKALSTISKLSISFRLINTEAKMRRLYKILYRRDERDCFPDGSIGTEEEPGRVMGLNSNNVPASFYRGCDWDLEWGEWSECPAYDSLVDGGMTQPRRHPHAGAMDENGHWNYVHEPIILKREKYPFVVSESEYGEVCAPDGLGPEGPGGYRLLTEKVRIDRTSKPSKGRARIFCVVYTYSGAVEQIRAIAQTWGQKCDGFMAASNHTDPSLGIVHVPHFGLYEGEYKGIWQRVRSALSYVYDNFMQDYDFFHVSGDDTYVIMDNLRAFLEGKQVRSYPGWLYAGQRIYVHKNKTVYMGGGSGYTLSRESLSRVVSLSFPKCMASATNFAEDLFMGKCLKRINVEPFDDRDERGEYRYHGFDPQFVFKFRPGVTTGKVEGFWTEQMKGRPVKTGLDAASVQSVAFHQMKTPAKMKRVHKILYRQEEPDCAPPGSDNSDSEPGKILSLRDAECSPYRFCTWDSVNGNFVNCPSYATITNRTRSSPSSINTTLLSRKPPPRHERRISAEQLHEHPFAGAKDANHSWGYVHDPTILIHSPPKFNTTSDYGDICAPDGLGPEGPGGYRLLTETVVVDTEAHELADRRATNGEGPPRVKLFCAVYSSVKVRVQAIAETWGRRCDGFLAASNGDTMPELGLAYVPHYKEVNLWQKIRSMLGYIYDNFLDDYDYFHITSDDAYLIVENLRLFLETDDVRKASGSKYCPRPLYIGQWRMAVRYGNYFIGGGYTLSRATISALINHVFPQCNPTKVGNNEDSLMGTCLGKIGVAGYDARDKLGHDRYHSFDPEFTYSFVPGAVDNDFENWWTENWNAMPQPRGLGLEAASNVTVSFRNVRTGAKMRRIEKILYRKGEPDCSKDGSHEPGGVLSFDEWDRILNRENCTWNMNSGKYTDCLEYEEIRERTRPPDI